MHLNSHLIPAVDANDRTDSHDGLHSLRELQAHSEGWANRNRARRPDQEATHADVNRFALYFFQAKFAPNSGVQFSTCVRKMLTGDGVATARCLHVG
jgi:hypothetical protein